MSNSSDNDTVEAGGLPFLTCLVLDYKPDPYLQTFDPKKVFACSWGSYYIGSHGFALCTTLCGVIWSLGLIGITGNVLNISVLRKSDSWSTKSFKYMLITLALLEMIVCASAIVNSTVIVMIVGNMDRGLVSFWILNISTTFYAVARFGANNMTMLIAAERFSAVFFPLRTKTVQNSVGKSKLYIVAVLIITFLAVFRWIFDGNVVQSSYEGLSVLNPVTFNNFPYIMVPTALTREYVARVIDIHNILDWIVPFPVLFILNAMLYLKICLWNRKRQKLTGNLKKDVNTAKMFSIVMLILLISHSFAFATFIVCLKDGLYYRDLYMITILGATFSASINILVYRRGKPFRKEMDKQLFHYQTGISSLFTHSSVATPTETG